MLASHKLSIPVANHYNNEVIPDLRNFKFLMFQMCARSWNSGIGHS